MLQVQPGYAEGVENADFALFSGGRFSLPSFRWHCSLLSIFSLKDFILAIPRIFLHLPGSLQSSSFLSPSLGDLFAVLTFQCSLSIALYLAERVGVECCMNRVWCFSLYFCYVGCSVTLWQRMELTLVKQMASSHQLQAL